MRIHVSLKVKSLDKSIDFYSRLFGQEASKTKDTYANFRLDEPPIHLALTESEGAGSAGVSHLGIELPDSDTLEHWHGRLEESGTRFSVEDKARCCYAQADKLWLTDPDGYRWEIWVRTADIESIGQTRPEVFEEQVACCA
jgi:catechol 2,3-dioxygenase-like lactoylglutathione lyase family enzyme